MSSKSPDLAALKRALGRQLAAARQAAEIGQQEVAHKTGYSRSSVAHVEAGRQLLTRDFWETADDLVQADGALIAGFERIQVARQDHERRSREAELAEARAAAEALRATTLPQLPWDAAQLAVPAAPEVLVSLVAAAGVKLTEGLVGPLVYLAFLSSAAQEMGQAMPAEWGNQVYDQLTKFLREWADTMNRRQLLQLLGWAATTVAVSPAESGLDTEEQERLARAIVSPSRVDAQVIDHIETVLQYCKRQEDALGPQAVLHTVLAQRQLVDALLTECPAALRPRLLSVHSSMSSSAGFYFFDLDDVDSAMRYCDQARAAAQEARNAELAIYALCNMSFFLPGTARPTPVLTSRQPLRA